MTMFKEIYQIATIATLAMLISADETTGRLTISLVPKPKKDAGETALTKDLSLTATPEEFDAGFVGALTGYREAREGLMAQAEATREVLEAAKSVSAKKATEAITKASKPSAAAKQASLAMEESNDDDGDGSDGTPPPQTAAPVPGESLALFG